MAATHQPDSRDPPDAAAGMREPSRTTLINRTLALDIIPRLVRNHVDSPWRMPGRASHPATVQPEEVVMFTRLVMNADDRALNDCIRALRERGVPVEGIFLDLLSPVARLLGHRWVTDECTCTDVAIGLGRLQQVVRDHSESLVQQRQALTRDGRRVLLTSARARCTPWGCPSSASSSCVPAGTWTPISCRSTRCRGRCSPPGTTWSASPWAAWKGWSRWPGRSSRSGVRA